VITGITRDSMERPVPGAEIVAHPGNKRTRSDSVGRFTLADLDGGTYTVRARKFGYTPVTWDVKLEKNGRADIKLEMGNPTATLDTVRVSADGGCPPRTLDGFACHRKRGGGVFLDYTDIDDKEPLHTADIFRGMKEFRVDVRYGGPAGPIYVPKVIKGFGCIISLVDGMPASAANPIPQIPQNIAALEIYFHRDSVPKEYKRYTSFGPPCTTVAYWTIWARTGG